MSKVLVNEYDTIQYIGPDTDNLTHGKFYKWTATVGHGVSHGHRNTYEFNDDNGNWCSVWEEKIGKRTFRKVAVDEDSLAGILSHVTFDPKKLKVKG